MTPLHSSGWIAAPPLVLGISAVACLVLTAPGLPWTERSRRAPPAVGRTIVWAALLLTGALVLGQGAALHASAQGAFAATVWAGPREAWVGVALLAVLIPAFIRTMPRGRAGPVEGAVHAVLLLWAAALLVAIEAGSLPVLLVSIEAASLAAWVLRAISLRRRRDTAAHELILNATGSAVLALGVAFTAGATGELRHVDIRRLLLESDPPVHRSLLAVGIGLISLGVIWKLLVLPLVLGRKDSRDAVGWISVIASTHVAGLVVLLRWTELVGPLDVSPPGGLPAALTRLLGFAFLVPACVAAFRVASPRSLLRALLAAQAGIAILVLLALDPAPAPDREGLGVEAGQVIIALALTDAIGALALASSLARGGRRRERATTSSLSTGCAMIGWASVLGLPFLAGFHAKARALGVLLASGHGFCVILAGLATIALARAAVRWSAMSLRGVSESHRRIRITPLDLVSFLATAALIAGGVWK